MMVEVVCLDNESGGGVPQLMNSQVVVPQDRLAKVVYLNAKLGSGV